MIRSLTRSAEPVPDPVAYRVPFRVERRRAPSFSVRNLSTETLWGVTLTLLRSGPGTAPEPRRLAPGASLEFELRVPDPSVRTIGILRWFRPDGSEYLWRIGF